MNLPDSKVHETASSGRKPETGDNRQSKTRKCLMCGSGFPSGWAGERICRKCKASAAWRRG